MSSWLCAPHATRATRALTEEELQGLQHNGPVFGHMWLLLLAAGVHSLLLLLLPARVQNTQA